MNQIDIYVYNVSAAKQKICIYNCWGRVEEVVWRTKSNREIMNVLGPEYFNKPCWYLDNTFRAPNSHKYIVREEQ